MLTKNVLIRAIIKCPASILAVSRKVKAKGRIRLLNNSTNTIKLIKGVGVPTGIRWDIKYFVKLTKLKKTIENQRKKDKGKVIERCLVKENKWGNKAKKFRIKTKKKIESKKE